MSVQISGVIPFLAAVALCASFTTARVEAQQSSSEEYYTPTIWIDPDGCEHWVMDDGAEGYMTPHTDRQGIPVCHGGEICGVINSDILFANNSARMSATSRHDLMKFFESTKATSYIITGHTDNRSSDAANLALSLRRANEVAKVAKATGARISEVRGYGERVPIASNATVAGMEKNRRLEIICIR